MCCEDCNMQECECDYFECDGCGKLIPEYEYVTECGMRVGACCEDNVSCVYYDDIGETFCYWKD